MHDLTIPEALFLGLVQGFTEWLPVSSSGHLVLAQTLFGISVPADFDIVIMFGTIAALIVYFRKKIVSLVRGILSGDGESRRYSTFIVLAGSATALIAFAGKQTFKAFYKEPFTVCFFLIVTGIFLYIASLPRSQDGEITGKTALIVGVAQSLASAPGISRSGSTIGAALLLGVRPRDAAEFSFILGIPTMIVASVLTFIEEPITGVSGIPLAVSIAAAFITGYASIGLFMKILQETRLVYFAYYCIGAGILFALLIAIQ